MDMFSGGASQGSSKKLKLDKTSSSSTLSRTSSLSMSRGGGGSQPLNSIPFSPSKFLMELSDDQKRLLALECETMGKSWLKVLKDEIKKPYFIKLKEFLWEEGVQDPKEEPKKLKVYPARKRKFCIPYWECFIHC